MQIPPGPHVAEDDGEIVVFMVGMTFNRPWKVRSWWPIFTAMPRMLRELQQHPELGLLSSRMVLGSRGPTVIQYWRSIEHLERFARDKDKTHMPAWAAFMQSATSKGNAVGIWHESYVTRPGHREALYVSTPRFGLGAAVETYRAADSGDVTAAKRRARNAPVEAAPSADGAYRAAVD